MLFSVAFPFQYDVMHAYYVGWLGVNCWNLFLRSQTRCRYYCIRKTKQRCDKSPAQKPNKKTKTRAQQRRTWTKYALCTLFGIFVWIGNISPTPPPPYDRSATDLTWTELAWWYFFDRNCINLEGELRADFEVHDDVWMFGISTTTTTICREAGRVGGEGRPPPAWKLQTTFI